MKTLIGVGLFIAIFGIGSFSTVSATPIINEIMQNPAGVSDTTGEWFELYNPTATAIDLNGWTLRDEGTDSHTIGQSLIIDPFGFLVLGRSETDNGGVILDYVYSGLILGNGSDELLLVERKTPFRFIV